MAKNYYGVMLGRANQMARSRNIKPGFFQNDQLVEIPYEGRLLFIGLWTIADRSGRLEDRPKKIKMQLFPADNLDVNALLGSLEAKGFIARYKNNIDYIQIVKFNKHQNPHKNEVQSTIPVPDNSSTSTVQTPEQHGSTRADSFNLIPDSLNPIKHKAGKPAKKKDYSDHFEETFSVYPSRQGGNPKRKAEISYNARIKSGAKPAEIHSGVLRYFKYCESEGNIGTKFVKQAATFFGPDKHYLEKWDIQKKTPQSESEWAKYAEGIGRPAKPGESMGAFIGRIKSEYMRAEANV